MLYSNLKRELLDMFSADTRVLDKEVEKMNEKMRAILRTTRLGDRTLQPGEEPSLVRRPGNGTLKKGLFANRDFAKGEYITTFPIDCTLYKDDDNQRTKVCYAAHVDMDALEKQGSTEVILANRRFAHLVSNKGMPLSMAMPDRDGAKDDTPYYWGHWADDGASLTPQTDNANAKLAAKDYVEQSYAKANATHIMVADGIFVWTIATRNIARGDEIFVTHGLNWWRSWNTMEAVDNTHAGSSKEPSPTTTTEHAAAADAV